MIGGMKGPQIRSVFDIREDSRTASHRQELKRSIMRIG